MAMAMARSSQTALCRARVSASRKNAKSTFENIFGNENIQTSEANGAATFGYPPTMLRTLHGVCIDLHYNTYTMRPRVDHDERVHVSLPSDRGGRQTTEHN